MTDETQNDSNGGEVPATGTVSGRVGAKNAKLATGGPPPAEIYVDGIAGLSMRSGIAKIDCYSVAPNEQSRNEPEVRRLSHRLVLPAMALNELMQVLQRSQEAIKAAREEASNAGDGND